MSTIFDVVGVAVVAVVVTFVAVVVTLVAVVVTIAVVVDTLVVTKIGDVGVGVVVVGVFRVSKKLSSGAFSLQQ